MGELLNAISEFLKSDLAKSHGWALLFAFIILLAISWTVMGFIFLKILVPSKTVENIELRRDKKELSKRLKEYEKEIKKLKREKKELEDELQHFRFQKETEIEEIKPSERKTLKQFTQ